MFKVSVYLKWPSFIDPADVSRNLTLKKVNTCINSLRIADYEGICTEIRKVNAF